MYLQGAGAWWALFSGTGDVEDSHSHTVISEAVAASLTTRGECAHPVRQTHDAVQRCAFPGSIRASPLRKILPHVRLWSRGRGGSAQTDLIWMRSSRIRSLGSIAEAT